jgi:hypothetical protein
MFTPDVNLFGIQRGATEAVQLKLRYLVTEPGRSRILTHFSLTAPVKDTMRSRCRRFGDGGVGLSTNLDFNGFADTRRSFLLAALTRHPKAPNPVQVCRWEASRQECSQT